MTIARILNGGDNSRGAVAPTVALSLFALIGAGGIAFDYARLVNMDTELQNAADQAALAAASQLDGMDGACARAAAAASTLIANTTRFANDGSGLQVTIADESECDQVGNVKFYTSKAKDDTSTITDSEARFVEVTVGGRTARYAFTPIVAAFSSGSITASAFAGLGSAVCGAVPFFVCSPDEPIGNTDPNLPSDIPEGTGIGLLESGGTWGPGNFGFLDQLGRGANGVKEALSSNALYDECLPTDNVTTETGQMSSFRASFNMRFDMPGTGGSCPDGPCSPSTNVRKDLVRKANNCSWQEAPAPAASYASQRYRPTSNAPLPSSITPAFMGMPRDICHSVSETGVCTDGRIGDGIWDRAAYFRSHHPGVDWVADPALGPNVTRYKTYLWEAEQEALHPNTTLASRQSSVDTSLSSYSKPVAGRCLAPGIAPDVNGSDRRRVTAAVVNCRTVSVSPGLNGKKTIPVAGYIDVFLVEPSVDRTKCSDNTKDCKTKVTNANDVYVEVIGAAGSGSGGSAGQITRRDVPYLIE